MTKREQERLHLFVEYAVKKFDKMHRVSAWIEVTDKFAKDNDMFYERYDAIDKSRRMMKPFCHIDEPFCISDLPFLKVKTNGAEGKSYSVPLNHILTIELIINGCHFSEYRTIK